MKKKTLLISLIISLTVIFILLAIFIFHFLNKKPLIAFNAWGSDTLLINDMNSLLEEKGYETTVYEFKNEINCKKIDYNIVFRGTLKYSQACLNAKHNILWQFYADLDKTNGVDSMIPIEEYAQNLVESSKNFDALIVSSEKLYNLIKNSVKIPIYYIPQFTNQNKFYFEPDIMRKTKILFVGHNHFYRAAPNLALKNNLPIEIYGRFWWDDQKNIHSFDIEHSKLHRYYSSAEIVLGDAMPGMREFGFIPNRIYDVSASGGFIISDYMEEIEKVYGDSIPMWKNEKEFLQLIDYYLKHPEKKAEKIKKAKEITLKNYTYDKTADKFIKVIEGLN